MSETIEPIYRHTQTGRLIIIVIAAILVVDAGLLLLLSGVPGIPSFAVFAPLFLTGISLLVAVLLMYSLTVTVTRDEIQLRFGIGLIRKCFRLSDIAEVRQVRNHWWHGWGIHGLGGCTVYNVSGFGAVELQMRSGKWNRIGTDEPERLEAAIRQALG